MPNKAKEITVKWLKSKDTGKIHRVRSHLTYDFRLRIIVR